MYLKRKHNGINFLYFRIYAVGYLSEQLAVLHVPSTLLCGASHALIEPNCVTSSISNLMYHFLSKLRCISLSNDEDFVVTFLNSIYKRSISRRVMFITHRAVLLTLRKPYLITNIFALRKAV